MDPFFLDPKDWTILYCNFQELHINKQTNKQVSKKNYRLTRFEEAEKGNPKQRENERTLNKKWTQKKEKTLNHFLFFVITLGLLLLLCVC